MQHATRGSGARAPTTSHIPGPFSRASLRGGPLGESAVLLADAGGEKPTGAAVLLAVGWVCVCVCVDYASAITSRCELLTPHTCVCLVHTTLWHAACPRGTRRPSP